jgi:16S rRNA (cytosine967-C5)-methyltransferase
MREQAALLDRAAGLIKPQGRIVYVTCSLLREENADQVRGFLARHAGFAVVPPADLARPLGERAEEFCRAAPGSADGLLLSPRRTDTDGFFVAMLARPR